MQAAVASGFRDSQCLQTSARRSSIRSSGIFQSDGQADQAIRDTGCPSVLTVEWIYASLCRMTKQTFNTTQTFCQFE